MTTKVIVVIGASKGIGKEIVLQFSKDENNIVIALSRDVKRMKREFCDKNIFCHYADISKDNLHEQLEVALSNYPTVDIFINTAGILIHKPFLALSREDINLSYETNTVGFIYAVQYMVPKMINKGGHIVGISTMGAYQGSVKFPGLTAYSSSKSGMGIFTEVFAEEFKNSLIRINCLCIGAVATDMFKEAFPDGNTNMSANKMAKYIVNFALNGATYYNGKILPVTTTTP